MQANFFYNPKSAAKKAKAQSEKLMIQKYKLTSELPLLIRSGIRTPEELIERALILDAFLHIHFKLPIEKVADWIKKEGLENALSMSEKKILSKSNDELDEDEKAQVFWYIESLWALLWAGKRINVITVNKPCEEFMAEICPSLANGEDGEKFRKKLRIRSLREVFFCFDLHFRLHYYAENEDEPLLNPNIQKARRKALDWLISPEIDWDDVLVNFDA